MTTLSATSARSDFFTLLKKTAQGHNPIRITSKSGNSVLLSESEYESLLETAELLSVDGLKESLLKADKEIEEGDTVSFDEVFG